MTGEMFYINPETGEDSNGECWPIHLAIAQAVGGTLKPFDVYQGPYIAVGTDLTVGNSPYAMPVRGLRIIRLWVCSNEVYREDTEESLPFWDEEDAVNAAKEILNL
jgi:hypothetical protein